MGPRLGSGGATSVQEMQTLLQLLNRQSGVKNVRIVPCIRRELLCEHQLSSPSHKYTHMSGTRDVVHTRANNQKE